MLEQFFQQEEEQILEEIPCGICCIGYEEPEDMENDDFNLLYGNVIRGQNLRLPEMIYVL